MRIVTPTSFALVLAVCAASVAVALAWRVGGESGRSSEIEGRRSASVPSEPSPTDFDLAAAEPASSDRRAVDLPPTFEMPALVSSDDSSVKLAPAGTLVVRAVDAETGGPIRSPCVRAVSATRYAERAAGDVFEPTVLRVTPGDYALYVGSPGYEPAPVGATRVLSGQTTAPEPLSLRPGAGRVLGHVAGELGDDLVLEIHGEGRPLCARCPADPCIECGRADDRTRRALGPTGEFAFEHLASGLYVIRLVDGEGREAGTPLRVSLAFGETSDVTLRVARPRTVVVAFDDVDGAPLDVLWSQRIARRVSDRVAPRTVDALRWSARFLEGEILLAQSEFAPPDPAGALSGGFLTMGIGCSLGGRARDDRARRSDDVLQPRAVTPWIDPAWLDVEVCADGRVRFDGVPARARVLDLRCHLFRASVSLGVKERAVRRARIAHDSTVSEETRTFVAFEAAYYD